MSHTGEYNNAQEVDWKDIPSWAQVDLIYARELVAAVNSSYIPQHESKMNRDAQYDPLGDPLDPSKLDQFLRLRPTLDWIPDDILTCRRFPFPDALPAVPVPRSTPISDVAPPQPYVSVSIEISGKVSLCTLDPMRIRADATIVPSASNLLPMEGMPAQLPKCDAYAAHDSDLKASSQFIIHSITPELPEQADSSPALVTLSDYAQIALCYRRALQVAVSSGARTIVLPSLTPHHSRVFGHEPVARLVLTTLRSFLEEQGNAVDRIVLCTEDGRDTEVYRRLLLRWFPTHP